MQKKGKNRILLANDPPFQLDGPDGMVYLKRWSNLAATSISPNLAEFCREKRRGRKKEERAKVTESVFEASPEKWHLHKPQANENHIKERENHRGDEEENLTENSELRFRSLSLSLQTPHPNALDGVLVIISIQIHVLDLY